MTAAKLIRYWRDSLADGARSKDAAKRLGSAIRLPFEDAAAGRLNPGQVAVLFEDAGGEGKSPNHADGPAQTLSVLLCPLVLRKLSRSGRHDRNFLGAVWLPAELAEDGALSPSGELPWLPRGLLEPADKAELTVGDVAALDAYLTTHPEPFNPQNPELPPRWRDAWAYADAMFEHVTGATVDAFEAEGYEKSDYVYLLRADDNDKNIPARHVLKLYDHLLHNRGAPLLERYMLLKPPQPRPFLTPAEELAFSAKHLGQMSATYPLFPSQRRALHHLLAGADDGILAVSGPPGTGKTTLLQSVVAALWVEAAVAGGEPPVIVATSANNQAITNVIARLGASAEDSSTLSGRWLPRVMSYGLYCPSPGREEPGLQTSHLYNGGFTLTSGENAEAQGYVAEAEACFLAACGLWMNRPFDDVGGATRALHEALVKVTETIRRGPEVWLELDEVRRGVKEKYEGGLEVAVGQLKEEIAALEQGQADLKSAYSAWGRFDEDASFWYTLFGFLPSVKKRRARRNRRYFEERVFEIDADLSSADSIGAFFDKRRADLGRREQEKRSALERAQADAARLSRAEAEWSAWCEASRVYAEPPLLLDEMDTRLRYTAFKLATHYWEGRWLLDMKAWRTKDPDLKETKGKASQIMRWRRYAKLAPCVVSTFYMLPAFFDVYDGAAKTSVPLYGFIDLLIVDEAGQAAPDIAAAPFALAKRALVIGDTKQLEPVHALHRGVDAGNIRRQGLDQQGLTLEALTSCGLSASGGNVMRAAEAANRFKEGAEPAALLLTEHHRCVPEIMAYFNELAYENRLVPVRPSLEDRLLPPFGYAHVPAEAERRGGSRTNLTEAQVIADWLADRRAALEARYGRPLAEVAAVVTPFKAQADLLDRLLRQKGLAGLTVGTVHVLQGGEREVVLFSSVYGAKDTPSYFFDRGVNMLNVAVSRAKDSFLVFGNMAVFRRGGATPSGLLGKYLFRDEGNELTDVRLPPRKTTAAKTRVVHLDTLEAHRTALAEALREATSSVHITSPFLSEAAVLADNLPDLIGRAVERGVKVTVYTDPQLNGMRSGNPKPSFLAARRLLEKGGAEVLEVRGEHSKTLITDHTVLIEGSFNWLSAVRDERSAYRRRERSLRYEGEGVGELIQDILLDTKRRAVREGVYHP